MKILFLSRWFPYPPNNGSKLRVLNLLRGLAKQHEITLLSFSDDPAIDQNCGEIRALCDQVYTIQWKAYNPDSTKARLGFLSLVPRSVKDTFSQEMASKIQQLLEDGKYDCIIASQADTASYWRYFHGLPAVFEEVELGVLFESYAHAYRTRDRIRNGLTWIKHRQYIASLISNFNACTVVSDKEKQLLMKILPDHQYVDVVPNCINLTDYADIFHQPDPSSIIFTGSFKYFPNYNAMIWFTKEILPTIRSQVPGVKLVITGDHADLPLPSTENVILAGFVDDVRPLIARSSVAIAPILQGGGTRLKILEAMALRTPVVATSKGAEGLDVLHGENILIADDVQEYATAVIRLLSDPELRHKLVENGYKLVRDKYNWEVILPFFLELVEKVVAA